MTLEKFDAPKTSGQVKSASEVPQGELSGIADSATQGTLEIPDEGDEKFVTGQIHWSELAIGGIAFLCWFVLFIGGSFVSTASYREALTGANPEAMESLGMLAVWTPVALFWTVTNIGLLACMSSILGAVGCRTRFTQKVVIVNQVNRESEPGKDVIIYYGSAVMRGFGIYMLVFAGLLVLAAETLEAPTQMKYLKLASTVSVMSFYGGYDPETFGSLLGRVKRMFENN